MKAVDLATAPIRGVINLLKNPILQVGAVLGVSIGLKDTIDTYKDFEAAMSQVKAVSGATGSEFDKLTAKAKEMGATTKFTATQSAEAFNYMAMAGWPLEKGTAYYKKAADEAKKVIEGECNGIYDIRMDENFYDVYAMSNNYNKETILGINYSPNVDWVQDSQLTSCDQFESLGGW